MLCCWASTSLCSSAGSSSVLELLDPENEGTRILWNGQLFIQQRNIPASLNLAENTAIRNLLLDCCGSDGWSLGIEMCTPGKFDFCSDILLVCTYNTRIANSIPSMVLQPLLGPGLPQKMPLFFSVFCLSFHPYIPRICDVSLRVMSSHLVLWSFPSRTFFWDPFIFHSYNVHPS